MEVVTVTVHTVAADAAAVAALVAYVDLFLDAWNEQYPIVGGRINGVGVHVDLGARYSPVHTEPDPVA